MTETDRFNKKEREQKKELLHGAILYFAGKPCIDEIETNIEVLKSIYSNGFRHKYSEFFPWLLFIKDHEDEYSLDYLMINFEEVIFPYIEEKLEKGEDSYEKIYNSLLKLFDHLNLEISRINYFTQNEQRFQDYDAQIKQQEEDIRKSSCELVSIKSDFDFVAKEFKDAKLELRKASHKASSIQTELIAVLSIFAAIVITFSGSISFISSALSSISQTNIFKSTFFILICGLVLFNTIFLLMYLVGKICERSIYANCESIDNSCGQNGKPNCNGLNIIKKRLPYVFWFNIVLLSLFILNLLLWMITSYYGIPIDLPQQFSHQTVN